MSSWSQLLGLSRQEKWLLAHTLLCLPLNALALDLMGVTRWQTILSVFAPIDRGSEEAPDDLLLERVNQTARMVRIAASRGPYRGNCLQQSITLWWLLRRQNLECEIRFGARRDDGKFQAHAWVEFRGTVLNEEPAVHQDFTAFVRSFARAGGKTR